ncbi:MAG: hypothetical protein CTY33_07420 [Methylotenera sp.]|nr:MAG: hypothetical protein CTY33_07420 [Methylotenera sp.]
MNKLLLSLIAAAMAANTYVAIAATTTENTDDASKLGTSDSPQIKKQMDRTDKGPTGVNQGATDHHDASKLGTEDTPEIKEQMDRTNKGPSEPVKKNTKNKVLKEKHQNHGTTKGNPVQPTEPESAPPASN